MRFGIGKLHFSLYEQVAAMVFYDHMLENDITRALTEGLFLFNLRLGISLEEEAHSSTDGTLPAPLRCIVHLEVSLL